jgi:hypothetical protein
MATVFAFLSTACASAALTALLSDSGPKPEFVSALSATAAIFAAFAVWTFFNVER